MTRVIGHERNQEILFRSLPPVSIFVGPDSVGKRTLAANLAFHHGIYPPNLIVVYSLDMETARFISTWAMSAPNTTGRMAIVDLQGASERAVDTLLIALEEAPNCRFIFISSSMPQPTLLTRGQTFFFGLLSVEEVQTILSQARGFSEAPAAIFAHASGGQVKRALEAATGYANKSLVLLVLKAFRERSVPALESLADKWSEDASELLAEWCRESITKRWRIFSEEESGIEGREIPLKILMALSGSARPKLVIRASLTNILRSL